MMAQTSGGQEETVIHRLRQHRGLFLVLAGTALLRGLYLGATRNDALFRVPYLDGAFYHTWAVSLAQGTGDFHGPYFLAPLYPHALALLFRLFGSDPIVVRLAQTLLGVIATGLVFTLGRSLWGSTAAYAAAALFALHGTLVFYEGLLVLDPLLLFLFLTAFAVLFQPKRRRAVHVAAAGVLLGLATLARATALLAAPLVLWLLVRDRRSWRHATLCAFLWLAVVTPILWRNAAQGGGFVVTTNGGVNFYAGNHEGAQGRFRQPQGLQFFSSPDVLPQAASLPTAVAPRPLTVEAVAGSAAAADSRLWWWRSWTWIREHPGDFALLLLRRAGLTLQGREIAQIESVSFHRQRLWPLRIFWVNWSWVFALAALGIGFVWRRSEALPLLGFCIVGLAPCLLFFVTARYRLAALPFFCLLGGCGVAGLVAAWRSRDIKRLMLLVFLLALTAVLTRVGAQPAANASAWEMAQMAERAYALGNLDDAIRQQNEALRLLPRRSEISMNLALYLAERQAPGDLARAEALLRQLVQLDPSQPRFLYTLGTILAQQKKLDQARRAWEEALRLDPGFTPARESLRLLRGLGASKPGSP